MVKIGNLKESPSYRNQRGWSDGRQQKEQMEEGVI